ncbi:MAG: PilZ domain-containing protein [Patescibacteria group bacterium]
MSETRFSRERRCVRRVAPFIIKTCLYHFVEDVGEIFNLSETGVGIYSYTEFPVGQKINVIFCLPKNLKYEELFPIYAIGQVVWQKDGDGKLRCQRHKTGIKFELILPEHQAIIREFIDSIPTDKPTN